MSCTENESGPFVVFFLPAVVGCLTILLARRWANSQVSGSSSTAVSRRRKIIKDPLIKRPLPPIACKMPPGSKKSAVVGKKGATAPEEENLNGKRRTSRPAPPAPSTDNIVKVPEGPLPPKHIPFPYIPVDSDMLFEVMTFVFTLVAAGLQFLNLYRTAWWLPHSHTNQIMNFYLIDAHLVAFIVTIMFRRLMLSGSLLALKVLLNEKVSPQAIVATRMFIMGVILGSLAWCTYFIIYKYSLLKLFYLCYPAVVYFLLFGFQSTSFLELTPNTPPLHCCSHEPQQTRDEVDTLREDFNLRVKRILFNSVVDAYYTSFIPCCFAQPYLYYDVYASSQQVAFVWGALFARYGSQLLSAAYCDIPHRAAKHLSRWIAHTLITEDIELVEWSGSRVWSRGSLVRHSGNVYIAEGNCVARPGDKRHLRFYAVFANPSMLLCLLLCLQLSLILLQLCLLFSNITWHNFLSIIALLFINYYTLFKVVRDYMVAWKVYKAENLIQDRNTVLHATVN